MTTSNLNLEKLKARFSGSVSDFAADIAVMEFGKTEQSNRELRKAFMRYVIWMAIGWLVFVAGSIIACLAIVACGLELPSPYFIGALNTGPPIGVGILLYKIAEYLFPNT